MPLIAPPAPAVKVLPEPAGLPDRLPEPAVGELRLETVLGALSTPLRLHVVRKLLLEREELGQVLVMGLAHHVVVLNFGKVIAEGTPEQVQRDPAVIEIGQMTLDGERTLFVRDNGVGIDPRFTSNGRDGHHGLQGMRERAARIQGRLTVLSSAESGTDISVIVPGSVSFLHPTTGIRSYLRKLYRRIMSGHETL